MGLCVFTYFKSTRNLMRCDLLLFTAASQACIELLCYANYALSNFFCNSAINQHTNITNRGLCGKYEIKTKILVPVGCF